MRIQAGDAGCYGIRTLCTVRPKLSRGFHSEIRAPRFESLGNGVYALVSASPVVSEHMRSQAASWYLEPVKIL